MSDPLAQVVTLLQPAALYAKIATGAGRWRVKSPADGPPFYCAVVEGAINLQFGDQPPRVVEAGHFVLVPSVEDCIVSSLTAAGPDDEVLHPVILPNGDFRVGIPDGPSDTRLLLGYCVFGSPDAALLISLLPRLVHVRDQPRLSTLVKMVVEESLAQRPARDVVLARLLEVLFIEAFRSADAEAISPGLMRGLSDDRVAASLRKIHEDPSYSWTVTQLAQHAALSRSAFFERFQRAVGVAPMEYLLTWRMALAKSMLGKGEGNVAQVAERVGYASASTFSTAFRRLVGLPPAQYARRHATDVMSSLEPPLYEISPP